LVRHVYIIILFYIFYIGMTLSFEHHRGTSPRYTVNEKPVRLKSSVVTSTTTFIPSYRPTNQSVSRGRGYGQRNSASYIVAGEGRILIIQECSDDNSILASAGIQFSIVFNSVLNIIKVLQQVVQSFYSSSAWGSKVKQTNILPTM
jgi:hypothetical protein